MLGFWMPCGLYNKCDLVTYVDSTYAYYQTTIRYVFIFIANQLIPHNIQGDIELYVPYAKSIQLRLESSRDEGQIG